MQRNHKIVKTATILDTASLSDEVKIDGYRVYAIQIPASWTTATITFQAKASVSGTLANVYNDAGEVELSAASDRYIVVDDLLSDGLRGYSFKIRSGTSATPVAQSGDITLEVVLIAD